MPVFDAKTLDNEFAGSALLASVLYATPEARAAALARGRERLAQSGPLGAEIGKTASGRGAGLLPSSQHA